MKLNRKGYMLVEIIVAAVLATSIAFYLLNLTYKFKNNNEDIYHSYSYMKDKILITKNIMSDFEKIDQQMIFAIYTNSTSDSKVIKIVTMSADDYKEVSETVYENDDEKNQAMKEKIVYKQLKITKSANATFIIEYGKTTDETFDNFDTSDVSYYKKELPSELIVKDIVFKAYMDKGHYAENEAITNENIYQPYDIYNISIKIPIVSIYDDNDYSINLFIHIREPRLE